MNYLNKILSPSVLVYKNNRIIDKISFAATVERIKNPEPENKKLIYQYRDLWKQKNNYSQEDVGAELAAIENSLLQFSPCQMIEPFSQDRQFKQTDLLVLNFERLGDVEAAKYRMVQLPFVYCAFTSLPGDSLHIIHRFEKPIQYSELLFYQYFNIYPPNEYHIMNAFCTPSIDYGFTLSFDRDIYFNPDATTLPIEVFDCDTVFYN